MVEVWRVITLRNMQEAVLFPITLNATEHKCSSNINLQFVFLLL